MRVDDGYGSQVYAIDGKDSVGSQARQVGVGLSRVGGFDITLRQGEREVTERRLLVVH